MSFKTDLNLQGSQYSLLGTMFYLGYFIYQVNKKQKKIEKNITMTYTSFILLP